MHKAKLEHLTAHTCLYCGTHNGSLCGCLGRVLPCCLLVTFPLRQKTERVKLLVCPLPQNTINPFFQKDLVNWKQRYLMLL